MGNNVIDFPTRTRAVTESQDRYRSAHEDSGRQAGQKLAKSARRLSLDDRASIARRLHDEIRASGIKPGRIAAAARLAHGTKELNKLAMKAGKDPKKAQLMAYPDRYYDVIKALAKLTRQNLHLVVDRITVGTEVHPTHVKQLGDVERTLRGLELLAGEVDKRLGLFEQYQKTFEKKRELQNRGDLRDWPFGDIDEDWLPRCPTLADLKLTKKTLKAMGLAAVDPERTDLSKVDMGLFDTQSAKLIQALLDNYEDQQRYWEKFKAGAYAFWNSELDGYAEGLEVPALAFLPHVYLGIFEDWSQWGIDHDPVAISKARSELIEEYKRMPATAPSVDGADSSKLLEDYPWYQAGHSWLLLYPDRQLSTIVPVLLRASDDIGSRMERVTIGTLIELHSMEFIDEKPMSAYERLVQVVFEKASGGKGFELLSSWSSTGRNLENNPYLRAAQRSEAARAHRDTLFARESGDE